MSENSFYFICMGGNNVGYFGNAYNGVRMMRIKDAYGIYRDLQVPIDSERSLYQKGKIKYGFYDIFGRPNNIQGRAESETRSENNRHDCC